MDYTGIKKELLALFCGEMPFQAKCFTITLNFGIFKCP
jgi:hypothetical protein